MGELYEDQRAETSCSLMLTNVLLEDFSLPGHCVV